MTLDRKLQLWVENSLFEKVYWTYHSIGTYQGIAAYETKFNCTSFDYEYAPKQNSRVFTLFH